MRRALLLLALLGLAAAAPAALSLPASDAFGYTAGAIPYSWTEISGTGNSITAWAPNADDGSVLLNLPFNFRFYGAAYNKVAISSNGYLQFGSQSSYFGVNCLGANQDPRNIAALYWMDLNPGLGGAVYTQVLGSAGSRVAVIQFQAVPPNLGGGSLTAQWRLYEADNSLEASWASTSSVGSGIDAVAGLRSGFDCPNRTSLPLSCQQTGLSDGLSVRFSYPVVESACGTPTTSPTFSVSPTFSASPSDTATPSISPTFSDSPTATETPSITDTLTPSPTLSDSPTATPSATDSPSFSASPTPADTATATLTASPTPSPSQTQTPIVLTDVFGYVAVQAPLSWEDISGTGTPITAWAGGANDGSALIDLPGGWLFRFYGANYSKVAVSSNGYLQFGAASSAFGHSCLPAGASPAGLAALFWMDLDLTKGGTVYWQVLGSAPSRRLVIQFNGVSDQAASGSLTAEAVLFEGSQQISLRYLSTAGLGSGSGAAAGLRSLFDCPNRTGLGISCDAPGLADGTQYDIAYPSPEPACGTPTVTPSPTPSASPTATPSASPSPSDSPTPSPSFSVSPTATPTPSVTETATESPSFTVSPTITETATISPTFSVSPTATPTPTVTETATISPTFSDSPTATESFTISPTFTVSPTATETPSVTETATESPSFTVSPTVTETATESPTFSVSPTDSPSPTVTPSFTATPTATSSATISPTATATPSVTRTATRTPSPTATPSATRTATPSFTDSPTRTYTPTVTATLFPPAPKPACVVLGQNDFTSAVAAAGTATGMSGPAGVALDSRGVPFKIYVADTANHRVLFWNDASALSNGLPADGVIGQADFSGSSADRGGAVSASGLHSPTGLAVDPGSGDLWVADSGNHRVLRFGAPIPLSGAAADRVLGQGGSFSSGVANLGGLSAASLNNPTGLSMDSFGRLAVADTGNHRALRFSAPGGSAVADACWGQNFSFSTGLPNQGGAVDAGGLNSPTGVILGAYELWVADTGNHRVLRFSTSPLTGTADVVLGQSNFSGNLPNQGNLLPNETRLNTPLGLAYDGALRVVVADSGNHRVVAFEPPYDNFADEGYGQPSLGSASPGTSQDLMSSPKAVAAWGSLLLVADTGNHRALAYGCGTGLLASTPTPTRSPTPTVTPTATLSPSFTSSPTISPSFTASETYTGSPTVTPSATRTQTPTASPTATLSATPSVTSTRTITGTVSPTPSRTTTLTVPPTLTPYPRSSGDPIAWPNPAPRDGGRACIGFPPATDVRVEIYNRLAEPVALLEGGRVSPAGGFACWDLRNRAGELVAPGLYYVRVLADGQARLGRLTVR